MNKGHLLRKKELYKALDPSLEEIYSRIDHKNPVRWKWRDFSDSPILVTLQNLLMDAIFAVKFVIHTLYRIVGKR